MKYLALLAVLFTVSTAGAAPIPSVRTRTLKNGVVAFRTTIRDAQGKLTYSDTKAVVGNSLVYNTSWPGLKQRGIIRNYRGPNAGNLEIVSLDKRGDRTFLSTRGPANSGIRAGVPFNSKVLARSLRTP